MPDQQEERRAWEVSSCHREADACSLPEMSMSGSYMDRTKIPDAVGTWEGNYFRPWHCFHSCPFEMSMSRRGVNRKGEVDQGNRQRHHAAAEHRLVEIG